MRNWKSKVKAWFKDETSSTVTNEKAVHVMIGLFAAAGFGWLVMQYIKPISTTVLGKAETTANSGFGPDSPPEILGTNGASWSK